MTHDQNERPDTSADPSRAPRTDGRLSKFRNLLKTMDDSLDSARRRRLGLDLMIAPQSSLSSVASRTKATKIVRGN
ncbi:MAG: hypothetical protein U0575_02445 [Phycisphaerales bacterium]